jgi:hypothetical protein
MRNWWFRNEPAEGAWKKWSAMTYFGAPSECRYCRSADWVVSVVAERHRRRVAAGDVAVLLAAVELVLLLVEAMHEIAGAAAGRRAGDGLSLSMPFENPNRFPSGGHVTSVAAM